MRTVGFIYIMDKKINWYSVEITVISKASEAIEFALNELDSLGNEINNLGKKDADNLTVIGYFNELPTDEILQKQIKKALEVYGFSNEEVISVQTNEIEDQDWLAEWKKHWKPTETDKFIISPPWENTESSDKIVIEIEPNMAFGTGTHETTKLCLRAIEEIYEPEMSFFDVGTGTGILAIAVAKIIAESGEPAVESKDIDEQYSEASQNASILACDTDVDSIKIAKENAELNNVEGIDFYVGSISKESPKFDFVCANVTADIIIPILPLLLEKSKKLLVLSGILVEQESLVLEELKKYDIREPKVKADGEWISITIKK